MHSLTCRVEALLMARHMTFSVLSVRTFFPTAVEIGTPDGDEGEYGATGILQATIMTIPSFLSLPLSRVQCRATPQSPGLSLSGSQPEPLTAGPYTAETDCKPWLKKRMSQNRI
ncbi:hypothetical protein AWENTII_000753 [Aspergillus wentii]